MARSRWFLEGEIRLLLWEWLILFLGDDFNLDSRNRLEIEGFSAKMWYMSLLNRAEL